MLQRILEIKSVGRFRAFWGSADELRFDRNTFIFWKNTYWKSTLTAIFRAIEESNPDFIIWRKSFNATTDQSISLEHSLWVTTFNGLNWWTWIENFRIRVFNNRYIQENVFWWIEITEEKQYFLMTFIKRKVCFRLSF